MFLSNLLLNTSSNGNPTATLGNPFQYLVSVRLFLLMPNLNLPGCHLSPLLLVLSPLGLENSL